jgi:acyl carrier protein
MDPAEIRTTIAQVLATIAPEVDLEALDARAPLRDQVDLDSMDFLNLIVGLHERLHIDIPESDYARLVSLDDLVAYLAAKAAR